MIIMESSQVMLILLYALLCILVGIAIVFVYKLIITLDKANVLLDDVNSKVKKLDNLFDIVDRSADTLNVVTNKVSDGILNFVMKFFRKRKDDFDE